MYIFIRMNVYSYSYFTHIYIHAHVSRCLNGSHQNLVEIQLFFARELDQLLYWRNSLRSEISRNSSGKNEAGEQ